MSTLRMAEGALPMATRLTPQPVALVKRDQSPSGSPTPISAKLTVLPAADASGECHAQEAAAAVHVSPTFIRSRRLQIDDIMPNASVIVTKSQARRRTADQGSMTCLGGARRLWS